MRTRRYWTLGVGLALLAYTSQLGCGNKKKSGDPGGTATTATTTTTTTGANDPATRWACSKDSDCVVSCTQPDSCCGQGCGCTNVYHQDELAAVRDHNEATCANRDVECRQYTCAKPTYKTVAKCEAGRCAGVRVSLAALPPIDRACASDADSAGAYHMYASDGSCCTGCDTEPVAKQWLTSARAACSAMGSEGCSLKKCVALSGVSCNNGTCALRS